MPGLPTSRSRRTSSSSPSCRRFCTPAPSSPRSASCARTSDRSRCSPSGSSGRPWRRRDRRARIDRALVGRRLHARRHRLAHRRARRDRDHVAARRAPPDRLADRRREPRQRRHGTRPLQGRRRRGGRRDVLAARTSAANRPQRRRRDRGRARRRLDRPPGAPPHRRPAGRGRDRRAHGYLAYLPAAAAGVSGVLAAVTIGVFMGWHTPELTTVRTRLSGDAFWEILVFLVNALALRPRRAAAARIPDRIGGRSLKLAAPTPPSSARR